MAPIPSLRNMHIDPDTQASCPDDLNDALLSDDSVFKEYVDIIIQSTKIAKSSSSPNVLAESCSMVTKMNGLLDPKVSNEVDCAKVPKDGSNILIQWTKNVAAGTQAFIPDVDD